jgi:uncharacterized protein (TIGR03067 family)
MRGLLTLAASFLSMMAAGAQDNDAAVAKDMGLFKGTWNFESFETDQGKQDNMGSATLSFDGGNVEFKKGDETKKGTYTINPAGKPKEIDLKTDTNEHFQGIYKFKQDTLTMCLTKGPDQARPTEFTAGDGRVLMTLKRAKE